MFMALRGELAFHAYSSCDDLNPGRDGCARCDAIAFAKQAQDLDRMSVILALQWARTTLLADDTAGENPDRRAEILGHISILDQLANCFNRILP